MNNIRQNGKIFYLKPATFWKRALAHNIDLVPVLFPLLAIQAIFESPEWIIYILPFWYFLYHIATEMIWGVSLGKHLVHIVPLKSNGEKPKICQHFVRNISKILSVLLLFGGFMMAMVHPKKKALHDIIADCTLFDLKSTD